MLVDDKNVTPLLVAASNNFVSVAKELLLRNCCIDTLGEIKIERTSLTLTPFKCALLKGYVDMCRLLVLSGYGLQNEGYLFRGQQRSGSQDSNASNDSNEIPSVLVEDAVFSAWLHDQAHTPWSLAILTRSCIRLLLGKPFKLRLEALPLPRAIKDYLLMKELLQQEEETNDVE